jgi:hypothetical protein
MHRKVGRTLPLLVVMKEIRLLDGTSGVKLPLLSELKQEGKDRSIEEGFYTTKNTTFGHLQFAACTVTVHVANC